jgi:hypothetical protein
MKSSFNEEAVPRMLIRVMPVAAAALAAIAMGSASPLNAQPLQPGPHSAIADIVLPAGTVPCTNSACRHPDGYEEMWRFNAPYNDVVRFLGDELGTGQRNGLPACPPAGPNTEREWKWADETRWMAVAVSQAGRKDGTGESAPFGTIYIACGTFNPPKRGGQCFHRYRHE